LSESWHSYYAIRAECGAFEDEVIRKILASKKDELTVTRENYIKRVLK
jgi:hypothetical protein